MKMQICMSDNSHKFLSAKDSGTRTPTARQGHKPSSEEEESEAEDEDEDLGDDDNEQVGEDYNTHGLVPAPPQYPPSSVRLPPWYPKQAVDSKRSS